MVKRIERPDISSANILRLNSPLNSETYKIVGELLDYIFMLERNLAWHGKLRTTVTGFDDVIDKETGKCHVDKCLCDGEE